MNIRFDSDWQYNGCRVLRLESDLLAIDVLPELGAKIYRWIYKPLDRDWLWQNPRIRPAILPPGTGYDDNWSGGWDELFPNCSACRHQGEEYPDHGEYWTRPFEWDVDRAPDAITLHVRGEGSVTPTRLERWMTVTAGSPVVRMRHRLTHLGEHPLECMFAFHPALAARPGCRLIVPGDAAVIASPGLGRLTAQPTEFTWPHAPARGGGTVDLSLIPESAGAPGYEMAYITGLREGWFALHDPALRAGFGVAFDRELMRCVWSFQTHGGWRGLYVANLEPCTSWPYDLPEAAARGRAITLRPGQVIETATAVSVYTDRDGVRSISSDGRVM